MSPSSHSNASSRSAFGSVASNSSVSQVANSRSTSIGSRTSRSRDGAMKRRRLAPEQPLDRLRDEDHGRRPAVARLEGRRRHAADGLADEVVVDRVPCPLAQVPERTFRQARHVDRPAREMDDRDPGEGQPEIDPEADGDARRHDGPHRRIDLEAERPRALEDRHDVVDDVVPFEPAVVHPVDQAAQDGLVGARRRPGPADEAGGDGAPAMIAIVPAGGSTVWRFDMARSSRRALTRHVSRTYPPLTAGSTWTTDAGPDRGREVGRLPVDEDVDVRPQPRAGLDQPVAHPGHGLVQPA